SALGLATATVVSVSMANEATAQAARSQAAQQILSDVFRKADPFRENGAAVTLKEALTRARPEIEARLGDDALLAFEVNHTLADIYQSLGLIDEEQTAFRAMLEAADRLSEDPVDARHLTAIAGMGSVLARTNPVEAVIYFDARLPAQPGSAEAVGAWLSAQYSYVGALSRVREFGRADAGTLSMAEIVERFGIDNPRTQGRLSQLRAEMARRAGDTEAEASHRKDTVEYMRAADNPSALAVILSNYAIYLGRSGRYDASEAAFKEALAIFEEANLRDPTYATVLRSYAGLLFRTNRVDEAIAAAEKSLSLLAPSSLLYARFVGELNLARYHFVAGNLEATLSGMLRALPPAFEGFRGDPAVPRRMLPLFAKALVFGGAPEVAQVALNTGDRECEGRPQWRYALEAVEDRRDAAGREKVTAAVRALEVKSRAGHLSQGELDGFAHVFASELPPFFDAQDRWEALEALRALTTGALTLPPGLEAAWTKLHVERRAAAALVSDRRAEFRRWAEAFAASGPTLGGGGPDCPD
ncbi:MAG: tetratricopeptide repeat protein, partial [Myxococcota bacterium]